jgi:hypothetical protein
MDIQGPQAARIMRKILKGPDEVFAGMVYFSCKGGFTGLQSPGSVQLLDGTPLLISRTGYTGEFGFELFVAGEHLVHLWQTVLAAGDGFGLLPCGLAARDSLRAGRSCPFHTRISARGNLSIIPGNSLCHGRRTDNPSARIFSAPEPSLPTRRPNTPVPLPATIRERSRWEKTPL